MERINFKKLEVPVDASTFRETSENLISFISLFLAANAKETATVTFGGKLKKVLLSEKQKLINTIYSYLHH
jgi:hypothetical protein